MDKTMTPSRSMTMSLIRRAIGLTAAAACAALAANAAMAQPSGAGKAPPPVTPAEEAMKDPLAADPVFWWRRESFRTQGYEPPPSFYWPNADVPGAATPQPFLPAAAEGRTTIAPEALKVMEAWAEGHNSRALIVIHKGKVQLERYWRGVEADEITNARAITRSFTPMMLGFAVADGKVELDAPIGRYLTEWADKPQGMITVRQVAQHVSGLEYEGGDDQVYGNKRIGVFYAGDVVAAALRFDLHVKPGTKFEVADVNTQLVSMIIERATGQPFTQYLSEKVWAPIGASRATYQLDRPGGVARTLCCMRATPRDLARLGQLFVQDGKWQGRQVLPAGWVKTMRTPSARNPNFGLGLWLGSPFNPKRSYFEDKPGFAPQSEPFVVPDVAFMEGGGFRELYIVPSKQLVILRLGYEDPNWDNAYLVNTAIRGMQR
jgi:CubicO group peptidase (beta-lactamase class C family)